MSGCSDPSLVQQLRFDNRYRFAVSLNAFAIACLLHVSGFLPVLRPIIWVIGLYSLTYLLAGVWAAPHRPGIRGLRYGLAMMDFAAITAAVSLTGGPQSPFFYL